MEFLAKSCGGKFFKLPHCDTVNTAQKTRSPKIFRENNYYFDLICNFISDFTKFLLKTLSLFTRSEVLLAIKYIFGDFHGKIFHGFTFILSIEIYHKSVTVISFTSFP